MAKIVSNCLYDPSAFFVKRRIAYSRTRLRSMPATAKLNFSSLKTLSFIFGNNILVGAARMICACACYRRTNVGVFDNIADEDHGRKPIMKETRQILSPRAFIRAANWTYPKSHFVIISCIQSSITVPASAKNRRRKIGTWVSNHRQIPSQAKYRRHLSW